jgi:hypothetical protein
MLRRRTACRSDAAGSAAHPKLASIVTGISAPDEMTCGGPKGPLNDRPLEGLIVSRDEKKIEAHTPTFCL